MTLVGSRGSARSRALRADRIVWAPLRHRLRRGLSGGLESLEQKRDLISSTPRHRAWYDRAYCIKDFASIIRSSRAREKRQEVAQLRDDTAVRNSRLRVTTARNLNINIRNLTPWAAPRPDFMREPRFPFFGFGPAKRPRAICRQRLVIDRGLFANAPPAERGLHRLPSLAWRGIRSLTI